MYLYWNSNTHDFAEPVGFSEEYGGTFRIQWRPETSALWRSDEQAHQERFWWGGDFHWQGAAEPGRGVYRVAVSSINIGSETVQCKPPLKYLEIEVETPTEEDRSYIQAEREVLVGEMIRCTREALTRNISEGALPVIGKYVE